MASLIKVDIVDSESSIFSGEAEHLIAPAYDGEIGIYPNHIPLITKLKPGVLRIKIANQIEQIVLALSGGFLEVQGNHVTVLADIVERTDELDEERLEEQKAKALYRLKANSANTTIDIAKTQASLEIAIAQLKALDYIKKRIK